MQSVVTEPPSSVSSLTSAAVIAALPPSATGQPAECASRVSSSPKPAVSGALSGQHGVRGHPRQDRPALVGLEPSGQRRGREQASQAEPGHRDRAGGHRPQRREHLGHDHVRAADKRRHQPAVARTVGPQPAGGLLDRAAHRGGPAAVERMRERDLRIQQPDPARREVGAEEERRGGGQRMDR